MIIVYSESLWLVCVLFFFGCILSLILVLLSLVLVVPTNTKDKSLAYECGFDHFNNTSVPLSVHFYVVAVLYIIFDIEIMYMFPWIKYGLGGDSDSFFVLLDFFLLLSLGYIIEYSSGMLYWSGYIIKMKNNKDKYMKLNMSWFKWVCALGMYNSIFKYSDLILQKMTLYNLNSKMKKIFMTFEW